MRRAHAARLIPTCVGSTSGSASMRSVWSAHPHVCGEHSAVLRHIASGCGSSPRVWGALLETALPPARSRLIPTCVGSTSSIKAFESFRSAHPHVCGEHGGTISGNSITYGSSPRVWGARGPCVLEGHCFRLIPTCVGSTTREPCEAGGGSAHPHVCGEHVLVTNGSSGCIGSSPRVWGAHGV